MSGVLVQKLEAAARGPKRPMGFGFVASAQGDQRSLLLLASFELTQDASAVPTIEGLDALLLTDHSGSPSVFSEAAGTLKGVVWGVMADKGEAPTLAALKEMGADFAVFPAAGTPASLLHLEGLSKFLVVDSSMPDSVLRACEALPVDGFVLHQGQTDGASLTIEQLLLVYRVASFTRKPLLVTADPSWRRDELTALRDAGALGIIVPLSRAQEHLAQLHEAIRTLPPRRRPRATPEPLVPAVQPAAPRRPAPEPEEPDEDDDDDF